MQVREREDAEVRVSSRTRYPPHDGRHDMAGRKRYILLGLAAWLVACAEPAGPSATFLAPLTRTTGELHQLTWLSAPQGPQFAAVGTGSHFATGAERTAALLDNYRLSFWAYRSHAQAIQINYLAPDGTWQPYLTFTVPAGGLQQLPNGTPVAQGDSVLITVVVDTTNLLVRFEPTGLVFNPDAPAHLVMWYTGANPDLDGNGVVDATDSYIEKQLLGIWVQEDTTDPWNGVAAQQSVSGKVFSADLNHFSGYAVSW